MTSFRTRGKKNSDEVRVIHLLWKFLALTENWIYPQIALTPGTRSLIYCQHLANRDSFPLRDSQLCLDPPEWKRGLGLPRLGNSLARRAGIASAYARLRLKFWRPELLHAHFGPFAWQMLPFQEMLGVQLITSFYGYDAWWQPQQDPVWNDRYAELFARGGIFLVEGPAMRDRLQALGCSGHKIRIHRLGVNLDHLRFRQREFKGALRVIMLARFAEKKGLADGLAACARAVEQGALLAVTIVGDAIEGDLTGKQIKSTLQQMAARGALAGLVTFKGFVPPVEASRLLEQHDVLLCPSKHSADGDAEGGSPVVLTEAMAMGLLCIGTRHCDIPEVILHGETGYLCESGNVEEISQALLRVVEQPAVACALCKKGRRRIEEKFSLATLAAERLAAYRSLLNGNPIGLH